MTMSKVHLNTVALVVAGLCLAVWGLAGLSTYKVGKVYEHRGDHGFRYALLTRVEKRLHLPMTPPPQKADA